MNAHVSGLASLIDHTLLKPDATVTDIERLCAEALEWRFAAVCVNPVWVRLCGSLLSGTPVAVCSVVAFPLGAVTADAKVYETRRALSDGAREVDMVMNIGAFKSGDLASVEGDIARVTTECHAAGARTKVIIEVALLTDEEKVAACEVARAAGADFVKTSTGFGPHGATVADVMLMRRTVGAAMGVKASGGIRDLATLQTMVAAGASRIGTSAGVQIMREAGGAPRGRV